MQCQGLFLAGYPAGGSHDTQLEISQRIRSKLSERPEVDSPTIEVQMEFTGDRIRIDIYFRFVEESGQEHLQVSIDRVRVEVVDIAE